MSAPKFMTLFRDIRPISVALALGLLTLGWFAPAVTYEFLNYDDGMYVYGNPVTRDGLSWAGIKYAFTSIRGGSWMPLTWLSHQLDVTLFGVKPGGHHFISIVLHAANAALLLLFLARSTGRLWVAAFVATVFALHPMRNESVVWIAERKDVLCGFFWMLGLVAYAQYVQQPNQKRFGGVVLALAGALMAKPMAVTFPFVLLLLDVWPFRRLTLDARSIRQQAPQLVREKAGLFILMGLMAVATYWSQREVGAMAHHDWRPTDRLLGVLHHYGFYLQKWFWPVNLTIIYPEPVPQWMPAMLIGVLLLLASGGVWMLRARWPWLLVGWFWFLGTAVPIIGLVRVGHMAVADRYTYLTTIGLALMVGWAGAALAARGRWLRWPLEVAAIGMLLALALASRLDLARWQNSLTLFEAANRVAPHAVAWNSIAVYHLDRGDYAAAIAPASRAIQLNSRYEHAYINRAIALEKTGDVAGAKRDLARVAGTEPRSVAGYHQRAAEHLAQAQYAAAIQDYTYALEYAPQDAISYNNRANARLFGGDLIGALADATKAIELAPDYANAYVNLGNTYNTQREYRAALTNYSQAMRLAPDDPLPVHNRAAVHFRLEQYDAAWADLLQYRRMGGVPHPDLLEQLIQATGTNYFDPH